MPQTAADNDDQEDANADARTTIDLGISPGAPHIMERWRSLGSSLRLDEAIVLAVCDH